MAQKKKTTTKQKEIAEKAPVESKKSETAEQVKADADKMIDAIDDLLKDIKADEFVRNFVQKGGQAIVIAMSLAYLASHFIGAVTWIS